MTTNHVISPLGDAVADDAARDYASDAEYRAYTDKVAPYRVIAKAVILARSRQHITQQQLAEAIGTTASAISRIESAEHVISLETLNKLGTALGISFVVGSPRGAASDAVVVPQRAVETPRTRAASGSYASPSPAPVFARER